MTINNPSAFMQGIWDWKILDGCFGETKIKPTDIDGLVERDGNLLILETKSPDVSLPTGQELTFKRMVKQGIDANKLNVVIVIWGENGAPQRLRVYSRIYPDGKDIDGDIDTLRRYVSKWFEKANG